ncbi:hypothetical protein WKI45_02930, partial [Delftia tsuruhatensis]
SRSTASVWDDFYVRLRVPGAYWSTEQSAIDALAVNVSLTDQEPAGVVNGISAGGSSLVSQLTIGKGGQYTNTGYVAQPATAGTYRVTAEIPGVTSGKSDVQTVVAAQQSLRV